jgi:hypothetical protein
VPDAAPDRAGQRILSLSGNGTADLNAYGTSASSVIVLRIRSVSLSSKMISLAGSYSSRRSPLLSLKFIKPEKLPLAGHPEYERSGCRSGSPKTLHPRSGRNRVEGPC